MRLTKSECKIVLQFAKCNRDSEIDCAVLDEHSDYFRIYYRTVKPNEVRRVWNKIIKKLKVGAK